MAASPAETPVSNVGIESVGSPIRFLYEELPNVYIFSAHKVFTTLCAPFPNGIFCFKILAMP